MKTKRMLLKVLISLVGCLSIFSVYTSYSVKKDNVGLHREMEIQKERSRAIDSVVNIYTLKNDSLYLSNDTLFSEIDSNIVSIDNSLDSIIVKATITVKDKDIEEALLWIDSSNQH